MSSRMSSIWPGSSHLLTSNPSIPRSDFLKVGPQKEALFASVEEEEEEEGWRDGLMGKVLVTQHKVQEVMPDSHIEKQGGMHL